MMAHLRAAYLGLFLFAAAAALAGYCGAAPAEARGGWFARVTAAGVAARQRMVRALLALRHHGPAAAGGVAAAAALRLMLRRAVRWPGWRL